ncbi:AAA family ATPase [Aquincola sp. MAHUQ-54]|uniref:AAA family ATPase n=1 Tax=Aquincola agrisoli TaxID=3119538 RepID=A0AAW9QC02_9BURK
MSAPPAPADLSAAAARAESLRAWLAAREGGPVALVETHISWVLLTPSHAYKLKKPLRLPFIDCATLARRRQCCEEELRLNRRLAPTLYLGVDEVHETPAGPALGDGPGPVVDVAVRMRRFAPDALWTARIAAGTLGPAHADRLAQRLADFHDAAAAAPAGGPYGTPAVLSAVAGRVADALDAWQAALPDDRRADAAAWPAVRGWLQRELAALAPVFEQRLRSGRVREGHGDLHLANLIVVDGDGASTAFDGIDFDPALRWIDVLHDIAFVVMDLMAHGADALAFRFLNAYLDASGDHEGLPVLRCYLVARALVRAQVAAMAPAGGIAAPGPGPARYLALALRILQSADARLAITHGLPGSGKSFVAQGMLEAAGAVRLRSDVERKRLHGLHALASSQGRAPGIYCSASNTRTYERLLALARIGLQAGWPVIVDAAFLRAAERDAFASLAAALGVPLAIVDCDAPTGVLRQRLRERQARGGDASEADETVLARLAAIAEPLTPAEHGRALEVPGVRPPAPGDLAVRWRALAR